MGQAPGRQSVAHHQPLVIRREGGGRGVRLSNDTKPGGVAVGALGDALKLQAACAHTAGGERLSTMAASVLSG